MRLRRIISSCQSSDREREGERKDKNHCFFFIIFFYFINIFSILILYLTTKGIIHISCSHLSIIFQHSKATFIIPILPIINYSSLIPSFISSQFSPFIIIIYFSLYSLPPFFSLSQRTYLTLPFVSKPLLQNLNKHLRSLHFVSPDYHHPILSCTNILTLLQKRGDAQNFPR